MFFSLFVFLTFYYSILFQCIYVIIIISIKCFKVFKILCKFSFIVLICCTIQLCEPESFYKYINTLYEYNLLFIMAKRLQVICVFGVLDPKKMIQTKSAFLTQIFNHTMSSCIIL